MTIQQFI